MIAAAVATALVVLGGGGPARADTSIPPPIAGQVFAYAPNSGWTPTTKMCMQVGTRPAENFALVIQNNCHRYGDDQLWRLGSSQTVNGAVYLQNKFSGKCLEVINYGVNYGDPVGQYTCYEGTNQLWRMRWNYQYGYAQFENVNSGLCLSVAGLSTTAFTAIVQNHCYTWATNEQFAPITQS
jgi:hypothetical protein